MRGMIVSLILASVLNVATPAPASTPLAAHQWPTIINHRGGPALYPEGTLTAFRGVRDNHPDQMIEFDVRGLKDGTLVVAHDPTIDRIAAGGKTGNIADMTLAQWRQLRIKHPTGGPSAPAATLQDVLDEFGDTDMIFVPELKNPELADTFIEQIWPYRGQMILQSTTPKVLDRFIKSGLAVLQFTNKPDQNPLKPGVYAYSVRHDVITQNIIDDTHAAGVPIWSYMVNDQDEANRLWGMGVDALMTDDPRLAFEGDTMNQEPQGSEMQ